MKEYYGFRYIGSHHGSDECAEYYNIVSQTVSERCKSENTKWHNWSFLEE